LYIYKNKKEKDRFNTSSADQLLMIRITVTFWHNLRTSGNANDEPLAKIASWRVKGMSEERKSRPTFVSVV